MYLFTANESSGEAEFKRAVMKASLLVREELEEVAQRHETTVIEVLRKFIMVGFLLEAVQRKPNQQVYLKRDGKSVSLTLEFDKIQRNNDVK